MTAATTRARCLAPPPVCPQVRLTRTNTRAPASYDFIGLNYYSHHHVRVRLPSARAPHPFELLHLPREEALMTDLAYPMYPEGFYHALVRVGKLGKPVYVVRARARAHARIRHAAARAEARAAAAREGARACAGPEPLRARLARPIGVSA